MNSFIDEEGILCSSQYGLLSKLRHFVPFSTLISIYHSLIAPCLRYGLIAWGQASKSQLNKFLVLQKRALRFIHFAKPRDHAIPLFINTKILPINFLYYQLLAETMSDVSNNLVRTNIQELFVPLSRVHSYGTRSSTSQNSYIKNRILKSKKTLSRDLVPNYGMRYRPSCAHFQNTNSNLIFVHHCLICNPALRTAA